MSGQLKVKDNRASAAKKTRKVLGLSLLDERRKFPGSRAFAVLSGRQDGSAQAQEIAAPEEVAAPEVVDADAQAAPQQHETAAAETRPSDPRLARIADVAQSANAPLPERGKLQSTLGASLEGVRAATGPMARVALDGLGAEAATVGNVVVLRDEEPDRETLVHEAIHVLQGKALQGKDSPPEAPTDVASSGSAAELEADDLARRLEEAMREGRSLGASPRARLQPGVVHRRDLAAERKSKERMRESLSGRHPTHRSRTRSRGSTPAIHRSARRRSKGRRFSAPSPRSI